MSYRTYRLNDHRQKRGSKSTGKVRDFIKRMDLKMKAHHFDGNDPIRVLDFLARLKREFNIQEMSEAQAFVELPSFFDGYGKSQYEAGVERTLPEEGGVESWPEAVQYLLRNYAQNKHISAAIADLREVRQKASESESQFATRLNTAVARCGNVHSPKEVITMYINGLRPEIASRVEQHRSAKKHATYLDLVDFATSEGDAVRAQAASSLQSSTKPRKTALAMLEPKQETCASPMKAPATGSSSDEDGIMVLDTRPRAMVPPPSLAHAGPAVERSRPGWERPRTPYRQTAPRGPRKDIVCHECYQPNDHISPDCELPIRERRKVVENYHNLSQSQRAAVPTTAYDAARAILNMAPRPQRGNQASPETMMLLEEAPKNQGNE